MKKLIIALACVFCCAAGALAISSDPSEAVVGARPMGMGKAFAGIAGDGSNMFLNPAGLSGINNIKVMSMSGKLLSDVDYITLGAVNPFNFGVLGIAYAAQGVSDIVLTTYVGGTIEATGQSTNYTNSVMVLSYARDFPFEFPFLADSKLGVNLKLYSQSFSNQTGSLEGASGSGLDMDLGLQFKPQSYLSWGINLQNLLPLSFTWVRNSTQEDLPLVAKLGLDWKILGEDGWRNFPNDLRLTLDSDLSSARAQIWHLGLEFFPGDFLALRGGIDQSAGSGGISNNLTGGVGINVNGFTFDYAYHRYGEMDSTATSYFSLGYTGQEKKEARVIPAAEDILPAEEYLVPPALSVPLNILSPDEQFKAQKVRAYISLLKKKLALAKTDIQKKKIMLMIKSEEKRLKELEGKR